MVMMKMKLKLRVSQFWACFFLFGLVGFPNPVIIDIIDLNCIFRFIFIAYRHEFLRMLREEMGNYLDFFVEEQNKCLVV